MASLFTRVGDHHAIVAVPAQTGGWRSMVWDTNLSRYLPIGPRPDVEHALITAGLVAMSRISRLEVQR